MQVRKVTALAQEAQKEGQAANSELTPSPEAQVGAVQSALGQPGRVDARSGDKKCKERAHTDGPGHKVRWSWDRA